MLLESLFHQSVTKLEPAAIPKNGLKFLPWIHVSTNFETAAIIRVSLIPQLRFKHQEMQAIIMELFHTLGYDENDMMRKSPVGKAKDHAHDKRYQRLNQNGYGEMLMLVLFCFALLCIASVMLCIVLH